MCKALGIKARENPWRLGLLPSQSQDLKQLCLSLCSGQNGQFSPMQPKKRVLYESDFMDEGKLQKQEDPPGVDEDLFQKFKIKYIDIYKEILPILSNIRGDKNSPEGSGSGHAPVSYTHLTLPTKA